MCLLFYRETQQFTESNPYKISANDAVMFYRGILRPGNSLLFLYYQLLIIGIAIIFAKTLIENTPKATLKSILQLKIILK